jgi:hypothetical protein
MKRLLLGFSLVVILVAGTQRVATADCTCTSGRVHSPFVHVGHSGPFCIYYVGRHGDQSPYRYFYHSGRYPRYYGGEHARQFQNLVPPGDIGIRDRAW